MQVIDAADYEIFEPPESDFDYGFLMGVIGAHDKRVTGERLCFRTGIYEEDFNSGFLQKTPFKGRGWHADFRSYEYFGALDDRNHKRVEKELEKLGYIYGDFESYYDEREQSNVIRSKPELLIHADNVDRAKSALELTPAALSLVQDSFYDIEQFMGRYGWQLDRWALYPLHSAPEKKQSIRLLAQSMQLAAKASHSNKIRYALLRLWASKKLCSVDSMVTYGKRDCGDAGIVKSPAEHTLFSQAIVVAYGAIEELGVGVRFDRNNLTERERRRNAARKLRLKLEELGVHPDTEVFWSTASVGRKIDRESRAECRDISSYSSTKRISLVDAIYFANRVRNKISAHDFNENTQKLTPRDVWNVQNIARYLIWHRAKLDPLVQLCF